MITLQEQIENAQALHDCDGLEVTAAILASLRRLQAIEAQEPVAIFTYNPDETPCMNQVWKTEFHKGTVNLYALPVSPEGYKLVQIEATDRELVAGMEALQRCQQAFLPTITTMEEIRTSMLAASEVSNG